MARLDPSRSLAWAAELAIALYRLALIRFPARLRRSHGDDMVALFAATARESAAYGWTRFLRVMGGAVREWLKPLPGPVGSANARATRNSTNGRWGVPSTVLEDLGLAWRSLTREPRFTLLVTGVLSVGVALTTGVFAVVDAYLLTPLPFPHPERLVTVVEPGGLEWDEVDDVFERAVSWDLDVFTVVGDSRPELLRGAWITPDFLDTYGVTAALGRGFAPEESEAGAAPVAMISHTVWTTRFGSDPGVVGRTFRAFTSDRPDHAEQFQIVGVLPADFWFFNDYTEVFAPMRAAQALYAGRLKSDMSIERAERILTEMAIAKGADRRPDFAVDLEPLRDQYVAGVRPTLLALQGAVLLVLLVACANGGVLLLLRSARRQHELGVRRALGASGGRIARQLFAEGALVAFAAGVCGALLAWLGLSASRDGLEGSLGRSVPGGLQEVGIDASVLLVTASVCALVAVTFGLLPLFAGRGGAYSGLRESERARSDSTTTRRTRGALVAVEVALSLSLLTGAGLMVRSALHLQSRELGFDPTHVVQAQAGVRAASYPEPDDRVALFSQLAERAEALPGVESVGLASRGLFNGILRPNIIESSRAGVAYPARAVRWSVSEGYFDALQIQLLRGRSFQRSDARGSEPVVVVSESLAQEMWPGEEAVGQLMRMASDPAMNMGTPTEDRWRRVIGVVADVTGELRDAPHGFVYEPYRQGNPQWMRILVRGGLGPEEVRADVGSILADLDSEAPLFDVGSLAVAVEHALAPSRDVATMLALFAAFAFALAVLGLFGVVSYAARQNRRAVAIRMVLGADGGSVAGLFIRQALVVVGAGVLLGWIGGHAVGRALAGQLHGVGAGDPLTHAGMAVGLLIAALVAVWVPARGASRTDPMVVLRGE